MFTQILTIGHFSTKKSTNKIEKKIQEHCLKLLSLALSLYIYVYDEIYEIYDDLLIKSSQPSVEIKRLRTLATEIFKTLNDANPNFMKEIFYLSPHETRKKYDL